MKRAGNLFERIVDRQNIRYAFMKAIRGKRSSPAVLLFCRHVDSNLDKIRNRLLSLEPGWGRYRSFIITDPKERMISAAPIEERIMHHAIMNVLEPFFERHLVYHSYACRRGKGTHAAVLRAFHNVKSSGYFLKLDIRKYFDSIDHANLKTMISRLIKDGRVLHLLNGIIDSYYTSDGKGLPIGNLTSQFFANLYLSPLDHYIIEKVKPGGFVRYMDDFVLWHKDKNSLKAMRDLVGRYVSENLKLTLKPPIIDSSKNGLPFLGFLIKDSGIYLLQSSKRRIVSRARTISAELAAGIIDERKAAERVTSVHAAVLLARTRVFRVRLWHGSGFGQVPRQTRRQLEQRHILLHRVQPEQQQPV